MGRRISDESYAKLPPVNGEVKPYGEAPLDDYTSYTNCRDNSYFKAGDIVWVEQFVRWDDDGKPVHKPQKAAIIRVSAEMGNDGFYRQRFVISLMTDKGKWSRMWKNTWPGYIQRGYELVEERTW